MKAINDYEAKLGMQVPSRLSGLTYAENKRINDEIYADEVEIATEKMKRTPSSYNLKHFAEIYGIPSGTPVTKLRELVVLDDWVDIFNEILPSIKRGAYDAIDWAHSRYV